MEVKNKYYNVVKRTLPVSRFNIKGTNQINMELCQAFRDYVGCDHVLRTQTHFMFCETIKDAEVIDNWELV